MEYPLCGRQSDQLKEWREQVLEHDERLKKIAKWEAYYNARFRKEIREIFTGSEI